MNTSPPSVVLNIAVTMDQNGKTSLELTDPKTGKALPPQPREKVIPFKTERVESINLSQLLVTQASPIRVTGYIDGQYYCALIHFDANGNYTHTTPC